MNEHGTIIRTASFGPLEVWLWPRLPASRLGFGRCDHGFGVNTPWGYLALTKQVEA